MNLERTIEDSELIINADGSVFHLHLMPNEIADTIILVGDPDRVAMIASYFDTIEVRKSNREFVSATGIYKGKRLTVVSTGIGTDNIDIVINELDALANVDFRTRQIKKEKKQLQFIRIGTSGSLQEDLSIDSWLISTHAIGFDGLLNFYDKVDEITDKPFEKALTTHLNWGKRLAQPYIIAADKALLNSIKTDKMQLGVTVTAPGFYGPQGRVIRLEIDNKDINEKLNNFVYNGLRITNYEMECSAIYGLSALLGHQAVTICAIIANRFKGEYSKDYKSVVKELVETVLNKLVK